MFTNKTENLDLPQWVGTDKANWDIDLNYAFKQISDYVTTLNEKFGNIEYTENDIKNDIQTINNNISSINTVLDSLNEVTTNHSSEISSIKEKVTKLQSDVSSLTTDFSESSADLTQRIQTIENDLPSIEQSITTLTQNYNALAEKVETLENSGGKVILDEIITFNSSIGTSSDTITKEIISNDLMEADLNNTLIEVSLAPKGIAQMATTTDSSVISTGFVPLSNISSGDLLLNVRGIKTSSFTGYLNVKFKGYSGNRVVIDITYSLQGAVHSFNGAPAIRVKVIKLR